MGGSAAPISFAGSELSEVRHICAFFNGAEEEYRLDHGVITADYGVNQTKARERPFHFLCLDYPRVRLVSAILTRLGHLPGRRREVSLMTELSLVSVVDDDESVRESLPDLLKEFGYAVKAFASAEEFLASDCIGRTGCLILDIAMPGMSGPDLQQELKLRGQKIPIIFITANQAARPRVLEQGAVDCLFKPFSDAALLSALHAAFRIN